MAFFEHKVYYIGDVLVAVAPVCAYNCTKLCKPLWSY